MLGRLHILDCGETDGLYVNLEVLWCLPYGSLEPFPRKASFLGSLRTHWNSPSVYSMFSPAICLVSHPVITQHGIYSAVQSNEHSSTFMKHQHHCHLIPACKFRSPWSVDHAMYLVFSVFAMYLFDFPDKIKLQHHLKQVVYFTPTYFHFSNGCNLKCWWLPYMEILSQGKTSHFGMKKTIPWVKNVGRIKFKTPARYPGFISTGKKIALTNPQFADFAISFPCENISVHILKVAGWVLLHNLKGAHLGCWLP